jgi:hypothetical protein
MRTRMEASLTMWAAEASKAGGNGRRGPGVGVVQHGPAREDDEDGLIGPSGSDTGLIPVS